MRRVCDEGLYYGVECVMSVMKDCIMVLSGRACDEGLYYGVECVVSVMKDCIMVLSASCL